ncbi:MAG: 30S ribosomal protein S12 methylthiotransferase RimO [Lachnospiraceae bacterium]|nr:30S ribosomal protein S12 methylthiotransferase RimO [Lachnospiraceae bacterium]
MKINFISLGCDKNLVDSEVMISSLRKNNHEITNDVSEAEIIVVNTCCFIGDAKEESINTIIEMGEYKTGGNAKFLIIAGCLAERYHDEIEKELPEVDAIIGTTAIDSICDVIDRLLSREDNSPVKSLKSIDYLPESVLYEEAHSGGYSAYLKIAEGCDKRCTYCVIPNVRGKYRSVPAEKLVEQAAHLVENGAKELILVAQETTLYGMDIYNKKSLHTLLSMLSKLPKLRWIRLLYCYPEEIYPELIDEIKNNPKVCHYIDMPIQHASDNILKRMGRWTNQAELVNIITKLREEIPDIAIRTTLITGFPGETEEDFRILKDFVQKMRFDRLGVFPYSQEENTPAASFDDQIEDEIKEDRRDEIMEIQQQITFEKAEEKIGTQMVVMVEGYIPRDDVYVTRSYMDAPDVDGYVFVNYDGELDSGDFLKVEIIDSSEYDLIAEIIL